MTSERIYCTAKSANDNAWERITHIGVMCADGVCSIVAQRDAVAAIRGGTRAFHIVASGGGEVRVTLATSRLGHKYLTTEADGSYPTRLIGLPDFAA